jgi:excisionase family DNA binding protein
MLGKMKSALKPAKLASTDQASLFGNEIRLMTVPELAARLNVSRAFTYVLLSEHGLPRVKLGRTVRFRWEDVEVWLKDRSFT